MLLGIEIALFHIVIWKYIDTRKKQYIIPAVAALFLAGVGSKVGMILALISAICVAAAWGIGYLLGNAKSDDKRDSAINAMSVVVSLVIIFAILLILGIQFFGSFDSFRSDVANTYLKSIYGTAKFSAVPLVDICIMYLFYLHVALFFIFAPKLQKYKNLFISISVSTVIYILAIGAGYVYKWAGENMAARGEYLTGFAGYMMSAATILYLFWGYVLAFRIFRMLFQKTDKKAI